MRISCRENKIFIVCLIANQLKLLKIKQPDCSETDEPAVLSLKNKNYLLTLHPMKNTLHFNIMLIVSLSFITIMSYCKKGDKVYTAEATIYNSGAVALDGCGWFLRIDTNKEYSPINLGEDYQLHNLKVVIKYRLLDSKFQCGWGAKLQQIELVDIKPKEPNLTTKIATMVNTGSVGADGCGWMIKVDTNYYSPKSLTNEFKKDSMQVKVAYKVLNTKYQCGIAANLKYTEIDVKSIQPSYEH
jgi:hypothetical protein